MKAAVSPEKLELELLHCQTDDLAIDDNEPVSLKDTLVNKTKIVEVH